MKNIIKATLAVAVVAASAAIGYATYNQYQNKLLAYANPLLVENINALAESQTYRYTHLDGKPENCTLYKYFNANTGVTYTAGDEMKELKAEAGWKYEKKGGILDHCPLNGSGCNPYSCQEIGYNAGSGIN